LPIQVSNIKTKVVKSKLYLLKYGTWRTIEGASFSIDNLQPPGYFECDLGGERRSELAEPESRRRGNKVFWALVLVAIGALILLHNLDYIGQDVVRYWPVILILLGIKKLID
jgi:hypothetical protein